MNRPCVVRWEGGELDAVAAVGFFAKAVGLLAGPPRVLVLTGTGAIHTIGMRYSIDVVFLSRGHQVRRILRNVRPYRCCWEPLAAAVVEAPSAWRLDLPAAGRRAEITTPFQP